MTIPKRRFTYLERVSLWYAYNGQCFWCGHPLELRHLTVDHVLPETLLHETPQELAATRKRYGLASTWDINSYANWVPAHASCNGKKGTTLLPSSPAFLLVLEGVQRAAVRCLEIEARWRRQRDADRAIAVLKVALENQTLTASDIAEIVNNWPAPRSTAGESKMELGDGAKLTSMSGADLPSLISSARTSIDIAGPYFDSMFVEWLHKHCHASQLRVLTSDHYLTGGPRTGPSQASIDGPHRDVRLHPGLHDRFLVIDGLSAAVFSANLTASEANHANETALLTTRPEHVRALKDAFESAWTTSKLAGEHGNA